MNSPKRGLFAETIFRFMFQWVYSIYLKRIKLMDDTVHHKTEWNKMLTGYMKSVYDDFIKP